MRERRGRSCYDKVGFYRKMSQRIDVLMQIDGLGEHVHLGTPGPKQMYCHDTRVQRLSAEVSIGAAANKEKPWEERLGACGASKARRLIETSKLHRLNARNLDPAGENVVCNAIV